MNCVIFDFIITKICLTCGKSEIQYRITSVNRMYLPDSVDHWLDVHRSYSFWEKTLLPNKFISDVRSTIPFGIWLVKYFLLMFFQTYYDNNQSNLKLYRVVAYLYQPDSVFLGRKLYHLVRDWNSWTIYDHYFSMYGENSISVFRTTSILKVVAKP